MVLNAFHGALLLLLPLQTGGGPSAGNCPGFDPKQVISQPYSFTYDSWVMQNQGGTGFTFGRCVESKNGLVLFVDWPKASLKGFASGQSPCLSEIPALKGDMNMIDPADLWYGPQPEKTNAPFRAIAVKAQLQVKVDPAGLPEKKSPPLKSRVKTNIPRRAAKSMEQAEGLIQVDLNFISTVEWKGDNYEYAFVCEPRTPHEAAWPIRFRWMAGTINLAQRLRQDRVMFELPRDPREPQEWRFPLGAKPEYRLAHIEFLDEQGKEAVASAPVAIYFPVEGAR